MGELSFEVATRLRHAEMHIQATVCADEPLAVVGPSGAGKSTLLRLIAGLQVPSAGHVRIGSNVLFDSHGRVNVRVEDRRIGMVFQKLQVFPHLSVWDNITFSPYCDRQYAEQLINALGIGHLRTTRVTRISGGEQQRVALARALAMQPRALLLDEPTSSLDAHTRQSVLTDLAQRLRGYGIPVIIVTHSFEEAAMLADRIIVMEHGKAIQCGTTFDLVARPAHPFVAHLTGTNVLRGHAHLANASGMTRIDVSMPDERHHSIFVADSYRGSVQLLISPTDISLSPPGGPTDTSMRNHLTGTVTSLVPFERRVRVQLDALLTVEVTRAAIEELGLELGDQIVASFKATAVRVLPLE